MSEPVGFWTRRAKVSLKLAIYFIFFKKIKIEKKFKKK